MLSMLSCLRALLEKGTPVVIATINSHKGSTPRTSGSKMLVTDKGLVWGTVGGGLAEGQCIVAAQELLKNTASETASLHFDLSGSIAAGADMICGGALDVWLERIDPTSQNITFFTMLQSRLSSHIPAVLLTSPTTHPQRTVIDAQGTTFGSPLPDAHNLWKELKTVSHAQSFRIADATYIAEPYTVAPLLIIAGGGHVSQPTAALAHQCGFQVVVIDDREEFVGADRFPSALATCAIPKYHLCFQLPTLPAHLLHNCYVIIVTRGHAYDADVLMQALQLPHARYIGMIGSKTKKAAVYQSLMDKGITAQQLELVHCPIGLPIKAETPDEIAVSIVAELISVRAEWMKKEK